jgi:hypothetical protein
MSINSYRHQYHLTCRFTWTESDLDPFEQQSVRESVYTALDGLGASQKRGIASVVVSSDLDPSTFIRHVCDVLLALDEDIGDRLFELKVWLNTEDYDILGKLHDLSERRRQPDLPPANI